MFVRTPLFCHDRKLKYCNSKSILEEIYRKVKTYIDALTQLEHASKEFEEAIKEQKSEAYEALSELWENNISQKESKIKWQLVIVADLLKDYINVMQEYIQPLNEEQNMRVDRDDILWNIQQINSYIYNFNWIIYDDGQSWNDYSRPFIYDKSEDKETNAVRRRIQEELENQERIRRQNNYNLLAAFREELKKETSVSSYTSTIYEEMCEIEKIYDNNIVPFENTDDLFAGKMKGYYDEWKSITNTVEDFTEVVYSFGRGLRQVGLDTLEDAIHMGNLLYVQELQATGQEVPEELQDDVNTYIKNLRDGISNTITDPGNTIEAIGQNIFDTVDEEGLAYATGYIAPEVVAIALATKKMTGKGPKVKGGTGVADDVVEEVLEGGTSTSRPTWRQSEIDATTDFPDYDAQKSFINGEEVPYGTKGSVRPDYYKDGFSVDIKNYNVEGASGRSNLVRNIEKQYYQRIENLPDGTKQSVMIDVRGQNVSDAALNALYDDIMQRTNNGVEILFKMD